MSTPPKTSPPSQTSYSPPGHREFDRRGAAPARREGVGPWHRPTVSEFGRVELDRDRRPDPGRDEDPPSPASAARAATSRTSGSPRRRVRSPAAGARPEFPAASVAARPRSGRCCRRAEFGGRATRRGTAAEHQKVVGIELIRADFVEIDRHRRLGSVLRFAAARTDDAGRSRPRRRGWRGSGADRSRTPRYSAPAPRRRSLRRSFPARCSGHGARARSPGRRGRRPRRHSRGGRLARRAASRRKSVRSETMTSAEQRPEQHSRRERGQDLGVDPDRAHTR